MQARRPTMIGISTGHHINLEIWKGHNTVNPPGGSRKSNHPWTGLFKIIECVGKLIKSMKGIKTTHIVHFNHLKLCFPETRFTSDIADLAVEPVRPAKDLNQTTLYY